MGAPPHQRQSAAQDQDEEQVAAQRRRPAVQRGRQRHQEEHPHGDARCARSRPCRVAAIPARGAGPPRWHGPGSPCTSSEPPRNLARSLARATAALRSADLSTGPLTRISRASSSKRTPTSMRESVWSASTSTRCSTMRYAESSTVAGSERGSPDTVSRESARVCRASNASRCATVGRRSQRDVATAQQTDDLAHAVEGGATVALDRLEEGPGALRVEVLARLGSGRELAEPLLQQPVELAGEAGPVVGELQRDPLVAQLLELDRAGPELRAHGVAVADRAADAEDDQHDRDREHDRLEARGRVDHQDRGREQRARPRVIHACLRSRATAPR